jgi:plastocyanin
MRVTTLSVLLLLFALPCAASDHTVFVFDGGYDPPSLNIPVGDTVTFKAIGNVGFHNAHADDDSFRCAVSCSGSGGDPAKKDWASTVAFTTPGKVTYHCDEHTFMIGSITVADVVSTTPIGPGFSGNWFDPTANQGGHGFQIEILPGNGMLAIWFVFNPAGNAQSWIYAQGTYDPASNTATLPAFLEQGGAFPPNFDGSKLSVPAWGSLQFTFSDCNSGGVTWKSNATSAAAGYADVSFPLQRLTSIAGTTCP